MKLGAKSRLLSRIKAANIKSKVFFSSFVLVLAGLGIFGLMNRTSASTPGGATVNISKGYPYNYNGWTTSIYTITTSAGQFQGTCAEPTKKSPKWTNTATVLNNTDNSSYVAITRILLVSNSSYGSSMYSAFNNSHPNFWSNLSSSTGNGNEFVVAHVLIGKLYTGIYNYVSNTAALDAAINTINDWFNSNYPYEHLNWNLYSTYERGDLIQDIVWVERSPQYAYINILKTDGDTGAALAGATLEFVGYSSAGRTVIATGLTTNAQGTLASPRRVTLGDSYTRYCFKETAAPSGYDINPNESCVSRSSLSEDATVNAEMSDTPTGSQKAKITVYKVDKDLAVGDYRSQGGAKLLGTRFIVQAVNNCTSKTPITNTSDPNYYYKELNIKWRDSTNNTGPFSTRHDEDGQGGNMVVGGSYIVKEKEDPNHPGMPVNGTGYKLNSDVACIEIADTQEQVTFKNEVMKGGFTLTKHKKIGNTETPFEGVTFHVRGTDSCGSNGCIPKSYDIATDANGEINVSASDTNYALPYGHYTITEVCNATVSAYNCSYSEDFEITSDGQVVALNGGNPIVNTAKTPSITTVARACSSPASSPINSLPITNATCAKDRINLSNFVTGTVYKITSKLMLKPEDGASGGLVQTAQAEWTHTARDTYKEVDFQNLDTSSYSGRELYITTIVSMKDGENWVELASFNADGSDESEKLTVSAYSIATTAKGANGYTNNQEELLIGNVKIIDTITLGGLTQGTTYKIKGYILDKNNQPVPLKNANGDGSALVIKDYTMQESSGTEVSPTMEFELDSTAYQGQTLVVYERLEDNDGNVLIQHRGGATQSVKVSTPTMSTRAANKDAADSKNVNIGSSVNVIDYVTFSNLVPSAEYTLKAEIFKTTDLSSPITSDTKTFRPSAPDGTTSASQSPVLNFSTTGMASGTKLVVYEYLYVGNNASGTPLLSHTDANDGNQQVTVSPIMMSTSATNKAAGGTEKTFNVGGDGTVVDLIRLDGLAQGTTYKLRGWMVDANGNEIDIKNGDGGGNTITDDYPMTASTGTPVFITMEFVIDTVKYRGQSLTVCEQLRSGDDRDEILTHCTAGDTTQTITVKSAEIETQAWNADMPEPGTQTVNVGNVRVKDDVTYHNLNPGSSYKLVTKIFKKNNTSDAIATVESETFRASASDDTVSSGVLSFSTANIPSGATLVIYEYLYAVGESEPIAKHEDPNDTKQQITVSPITLSTSAVSEADGTTKTFNVGGDVTIKDTITLDGLAQGTTYKLRGWMVDANGNEIDIRNGDGGGNTITSSYTSTSGAHESTTMDFVFDTVKYRGQSLTVCEQLRSGDDRDEILTHCTAGEAAQTVSVKSVNIKTFAKNANNNTRMISIGTVSVIDYVEYHNLDTNTEYTLKAEIYAINGSNLTKVADATPVSFTPSASDGTTTEAQSPKFTFSTTPYSAGTTLVVYEYLFADSTEIANHKERNNSDQQVTISPITMGTMAARDDNPNSKEFNVGGIANIRDDISLIGLTQGTTYKIKGWVVDQDGHVVTLQNGAEQSDLDDDPNTITVSYTMEEATGTEVFQTMNFHVDTLQYAGKKLTVYEQLLDNTTGDVIISVEVLANRNQTITVNNPSIETIAESYDVAGAKTLNRGNVTVIDYVRYFNLNPGTKYWLQASIYKTGDLNNPVAASDRVSFTPSNSNGRTPADSSPKLHFSTTEMAEGTELVVYEYLYVDGVEDSIADHTEVVDSQKLTVGPVTIQTTAVNKADPSTKEFYVGGDAEIHDTVAMTGLVKNTNYKLKGWLVDSSGNKVAIKNGNNEDANTIINTFTMNSESNTPAVEVMDFTFDTVRYFGKSLTVFEQLLDENGHVIASHEDLTDNGQTITVKTPYIRTLAKDGLETGDEQDDVIEPMEGQKIEDTVTYSGLKPGAEFTITGKIMKKSDGTELLIDGQAVSSQVTFNASSTGAGTVEVIFDLDATDLPGVDLVVFEKLYEGTNTTTEELLKHEDITDQNQNIYVRPRIGTIAADAYDSDQIVGVGDVEIVDRIKYEGLRPGIRYIMEGTLVDKETGEEISTVERCEREEGDDETDDGDDGNDGESGDDSGDEEDGDEEDGDDEEPCVNSATIVTSTARFTVGEGDTMEPDGEVEMHFKFNTRDFIGKQLVVVEHLYYADEYDAGATESISWHYDLEDESQTVTVAVPEIKTSATDQSDGDKELNYSGIVTLTDKVEYSGLVAGTEYTLRGKVVDKETGEAITLADGTVDTEIKVVAKGDSGYFTMDLEFRADAVAGRDVVVFEYLYIEDFKVDDETGEVEVLQKEIAKHEDLGDQEQTVHVKMIPPDTGQAGKREDTTGAAIITSSIVGVISATVFVFVVVFKKGSSKIRRNKFGF